VRTHALLLAVLVACGGDETTAPPESLTFPDGFLFGSAIAGFQADMGCPTLPDDACVDARSDWYAYATDPMTVADGSTYLSGQDPALVGPGHWELYESDFDRAAQELGHGALRFSLEWSRIFPEPTDGIEGHDALLAVADPEAIAHYHAVLEALRDRGLTPLVTLNHYTLPSWIHDAVGCHFDIEGCSPRGWLDRERTLTEIAKYAAFCAEEFGGAIDLWATLNEPFAVVLPGYLFPTLERSNPPAVTLRFEEAKEVLVALVEAHARMYDAVKQGDGEDADGDGESSQVGVVYAMAPVRPLDPNDAIDVQGAEELFYLFNMVYLNGVVNGDLDDDLDGVAEHRDDLAGRMDYLGINYYTRATVEGTAAPFLPDLSPLSHFNPLTAQLWEDYPRGLYEMALLARDMGVPMIITENGTQDPNDDGTGASFLVRHLSWLSRAIRDGADVRGYFYWTLMDNFEWNHGMGFRFGLYAVDESVDKRRTPRQSVAVYRQITEARAIPAALAERYPTTSP
jgi:beta-glucosidase/6-phospho-beta-glucosidase/beta-galactosidase